MEHRKRTGLTAAGLLLIAAALFLTAHHIWRAWSAGQSAKEAARQVVRQTPPHRKAVLERERPELEPNPPLASPDPEREMPTVEVDGNQYIGMLDIPALGLSLPVMDMWSDAKLKLAPCRYQGSAYRDDLIIAAHNYRQHFGSLKDLKVGDEVVFTDVEGSVFFYTVSETGTLDGSAVEEMGQGDWALTLFTCTLGGKRRVTVRCERAETGETRAGSSLRDGDGQGGIVK